MPIESISVGMSCHAKNGDEVVNFDEANSRYFLLDFVYSLYHVANDY